jgi:DNA polymerase-3 subunit gamma/tau
MTEYQVLARRWRPQRFEDLVGQDVVVRILRNALTTGQVAHAYLFSGLRGVGKTSVARLLAKALNCEHGPTPEPCGVCTACREIAAGSALDVLELDAASNRGIDEVRDLREAAKVLPVRDRYRVFILDEAHQLTREAFNALLKILEEPPRHVVFILASTEKHKFPATILSRCLQVDFRPIPVALITQRLLHVAASDGFPLSPGAAELIARAAEGSLRDGLSLLDRVRAFASGQVDEEAVGEVLGLPPMTTLLTLWDALEEADIASVLELLKGEEGAGHDLVALYDQAVQLLDTMLLLSCDAAAPMPFAEGQRQAIVDRASAVGTATLLRILTLALEQRTLIGSAERPAQAVAVSIARLALWPRLRRVEALLAGEHAPPPASTPDRKPQGRSSPSQASPGQEPSRRQPAPPPTDPKSRLVAALDEAGSHVLAGRVRRVQTVAVDGDTLQLTVENASGATVRSLREAGDELASAARRAGLAEKVVVAEDAAAVAGDDLRTRVESSDTVKRVLEIFGGRIEKVEGSS